MEGLKEFSEKCLYQLIDFNDSNSCSHKKNIIKMIKKFDKKIKKDDDLYVPEFYEKYFTLNTYFYTYEEVINFIKFMKKNEKKGKDLDDFSFIFKSEYEDKKFGIITLIYTDNSQEEIIASPKMTCHLEI